jgi:hypothetical protein
MPVEDEDAARADVMTEVAGASTRAKLLAWRGETRKAERLARRAVRLADETDSPNTRADTRVALAQILSACGRSEPSDETFGAAVTLYEQKGNAAAARRAAALREQPAELARRRFSDEKVLVLECSLKDGGPARSTFLLPGPKRRSESKAGKGSREADARTRRLERSRRVA